MIRRNAKRVMGPTTFLPSRIDETSNDRDPTRAGQGGRTAVWAQGSRAGALAARRSRLRAPAALPRRPAWARLLHRSRQTRHSADGSPGIAAELISGVELSTQRVAASAHQFLDEILGALQRGTRALLHQLDTAIGFLV